MQITHFLGYILSAAGVLFLAHVVRAVRWAALFSPDDLPRRFHLLLGLAIGYAANAVIPFRLGEVLRAMYVSKRVSIRFPYVAATVVAERLSDVIAVSVLMSCFSLDDGHPALWSVGAWGMLLAGLLLLFCFGVQRSPRLRLQIWRVASIFNDRIRFRLIDFSWSLGELVTGGALIRIRYLAATVLMWALYLFSYYLFSVAVETGFAATFVEMLGAPLRSRISELAGGQLMHAYALAVFAGLPVVGVLMYGLLWQWPRIFRMMQARGKYERYAARAVSEGTRQRFRAEAEYDYFLVALFSGNNNAASRFGMEALENGRVHKLYGGGSDAITALIEVADSLVIRKFASGEAGDKLALQRDWLIKYREHGLPLVEVLAGHRTPTAYYYDMPLVVPANDFFDFIHTNPYEHSRKILGEVLDHMSRLHMRHSSEDTQQATIDKYLLEKAINNTAKILDFARGALPGNAYEVNGWACNLEQWNRLQDPAWLARQIELKSSTVVHGDLTIENIIVAPSVGSGWYIIDPNPDNVFNSQLVDWGKMLQSLHLGYEGLNRNPSCKIDGTRITLAFTRSLAYTQLHNFVEQLLLERFGQRGLREAYFHELVHYLRLVPYKIRQNPAKGLAFFACASVLLNEYLERFDA